MVRWIRAEVYFRSRGVSHVSLQAARNKITMPTLVVLNLEPGICGTQYAVHVFSFALRTTCMVQTPPELILLGRK